MQIDNEKMGKCNLKKLWKKVLFFVFYSQNKSRVSCCVNRDYSFDFLLEIWGHLQHSSAPQMWNGWLHLQLVCLAVALPRDAFRERPTALDKLMSFSHRWIQSNMNSCNTITAPSLQILMNNAQRILPLYPQLAAPPRPFLLRRQVGVLSEAATREGRLCRFFTCVAPAAVDGAAPCLSRVAGSYLSTLALNN